MTEVGYIRISNFNQDDVKQLADVTIDHVFKEQISSKTLKRPKLQECLNFCRAGDTLHVNSMDRLARNLRELQQIVYTIIKKEVKVQFHKENLIFTGEDNPPSKLMLQIIDAVFEFERSLLKERQKEGMEAAKKRGVKLGRKPLMDDKKKEQIISFLNDRLTKKEIALRLGVSYETIRLTLRKIEKDYPRTKRI
ncbi:MAG: recombinase family protein [Desulfobacteraceae bacterium]|nr:recombinase family protein [Desulfobacteraceae bacterium]